MSEEIGTTAGAIWQTLEAHGEMTLAQLKKEVKAKSPLFDWANGLITRPSPLQKRVDGCRP